MSASVEMPKYQCHKQVWALKVADIFETHSDPERPIELHFEDLGYGPRTVSKKWFREKRVCVGGYLITYDDGYESFSPGDVFEAGYTKLARPGTQLEPFEVA